MSFSYAYNSALYGLLHSNYARFDEVTSECMTDIVSRRSFNNSPNGTASSVKVFDTLTILLIECVSLFSVLPIAHQSLPDISLATSRLSASMNP